MTSSFSQRYSFSLEVGQPQLDRLEEKALEQRSPVFGRADPHILEAGCEDGPRFVFYLLACPDSTRPGQKFFWRAPVSWMKWLEAFRRIQTEAALLFLSGSFVVPGPREPD